MKHAVARSVPSDDSLPCESDLQLLFSLLNVRHFAGLLPGYSICYNERLRSIAGRITYRPRLIELSAALLGKYPQHLEETLLHEMVHAWLRLNKQRNGHGADFKRKMREVGLRSIYHPMPVSLRRSRRRYTLSCPACSVQLTRRRRPGVPVSCAKCSPKRYDERFRMTVREL